MQHGTAPEILNAVIRHSVERYSVSVANFCGHLGHPPYPIDGEELRCCRIIGFPFKVLTGTMPVSRSFRDASKYALEQAFDGRLWLDHPMTLNVAHLQEFAGGSFAWLIQRTRELSLRCDPDFGWLSLGTNAQSLSIFQGLRYVDVDCPYQPKGTHLIARRPQKRAFQRCVLTLATKDYRVRKLQELFYPLLCRDDFQAKIRVRFVPDFSVVVYSEAQFGLE